MPTDDSPISSLHTDDSPVATLSHTDDQSCPKVSTVGSAQFNLTEWTRKTWYIQAQQIVQYQQLEDLYCVAATYDLDNKTVPFFRGTVVTVYNYANVGQVNGPNQNKDNMTLVRQSRNPNAPLSSSTKRLTITSLIPTCQCARAVDATDSSKLAVAPCFLPNILAGPYWVLGIGTAKDGTYEWAVVIGGEPSVKWDDGCTTKEEGTNGAGLWLFSRTPTASKKAMAAMYDLLKTKGVARSRLHEVPHAKCKYDGAFLK